LVLAFRAWSWRAAVFWPWHDVGGGLLEQGNTGAWRIVLRPNSERQSSKIRELIARFLTLDEQAKALGLSRSTAWTIRKASHKASGLSASIINRMLAASELPPLARTKILEYVEEKAAGLYGGSRSQRRKFAARLSIEKLPVCGETESALVPEHDGITGANGERPWVIPEGRFGSRS